MPPVKLFSLEEANAIVPRLELAMTRLQRAALRLREEVQTHAAANGLEEVATEELLRHRPAARVLVEELDAAMHEIEASGGQLKDVQLGLVDFAAEVGGEIVNLCWQFGEPEVGYWHRVNEGFANRRPLPGGTRSRQLQ